MFQKIKSEKLRVSVENCTFLDKIYCKDYNLIINYECVRSGIMASSREYLGFVLEQLSEVSGISYRAMMGEYIIYCQGKVIGGIYDDRFLVKPTASAKRLMPDAPYELPYEGGSEMLMVEDIDNKEFLRELIEHMADELPMPKKKK